METRWCIRHEMYFALCLFSSASTDYHKSGQTNPLSWTGSFGYCANVDRSTQQKSRNCMSCKYCTPKQPKIPIVLLRSRELRKKAFAVWESISCSNYQTYIHTNAQVSTSKDEEMYSNKLLEETHSIKVMRDYMLICACVLVIHVGSALEYAENARYY